MFSGRRSTAAYILSDMADDTFGLMDHLGIDAAHVVGVSMGGMIGQTMAIRRPERVRSLVSIMSTTGNRRIGSPTLKAWGVLLGRYPQYARGIRRTGRAQTLKVMGSPDYPMDEEHRWSWRGRCTTAATTPPGSSARSTRSAPPATARRRCAARVPTTVLHGSRDPLARPPPAAPPPEAIPGARLRLFEGMGHDLPRELWPDFVEEIAANAPSAAALRELARPPEPAPKARVRLRGVEPPRAFAHTDLNRARLPVPPQPREQAIYRVGPRTGRGRIPAAR